MAGVGEELAAAAFSRRAGPWLGGTQLFPCATTQLAGIMAPEGSEHRTDVLGPPGAVTAGMEGMARSGPFPSWSCLSPFSRMLQAPGERTPDLHTPGSSHITPVVSCRSQQSQNSAGPSRERAKKPWSYPGNAASARKFGKSRSWRHCPRRN